MHDAIIVEKAEKQLREQNIGAPVEGETVYVRVDAFLEEPHACTSEEKNQSLE